VVIPKRFCDDLGLREGDFVEVRRAQGTLVIKPKRLVDADDILSAHEESVVRKGESELARGEYVTLAKLHHDLERPALSNRGKTT
jgi:AbrB family looped-hinge helix DNA binding protein